jgi:hypothetical protein
MGSRGWRLVLALTSLGAIGTAGRRPCHEWTGGGDLLGVLQDSAVLVARAEDEGSRHRRVAQPPVTPVRFLGPYSGTAERRCVAGVAIGPVRSGEFVIGGQLGESELGKLGAFPGPRRGKGAKIWWNPLHSAQGMGLLVRARRLGTADTLTFSSTILANEGSPTTRFFPTGFVFPSAGRWLVVATADANWGCFVLTVR